MRKWPVMLGFIPVVLLIVGPWMIGIWLKYQYEKMIALYNQTGSFQIEIKNYQRNWFTSDVSLIINSREQTPQKILIGLGIDADVLPAQIHFTLDQHIQHGPIIYRNIQHLPTRFALAAAHNTLHFADEMKKLLQKMGVHTLTLQPDDNCVTFAGNYLQHFSIENLQLYHPENHARIWIKDLQATFWLQIEMPHVQANIEAEEIAFANKKNALSFSNLQLHLDQHPTASGLWIGKNNWNIEEVRWKEKSMPLLTIKNVRLDNDLQESGGKFWSRPRLKIDMVSIENETVGPIQMQLTAKKLNSQALMEMVGTYEDILQRGEFYRSELWQRLTFILPSLMVPGASIKLDKLDLATTEGDMQIKAGFLWSNKKLLPAVDITEMLNDGNMYAKARASKAFVSKVIEVLSALPLFRQVPEQALDDLSVLENNATSAIQRNAFILASLVDDRQLIESDGEDLIDTLRNEPVGDAYENKVKQLFLTKTISPFVAYVMYWNDAYVENLVMSYRHQVAQYQYVVSQQLRNQFNGWVAQGYIKQDDKNYSVSMKRDEGILTVNGKKI